MTTSTKKTAKAAATPFDAFSFQAPGFEVPSAVREFAEKSVSQARDAYAKLRTAADETNGIVEETLETARVGAVALGAKALDAAKTNTDASFALARDLFNVKSVSEFIEVQSRFARSHFDTVAGQIKEFQAIAEKVVVDTAKPATAKAEKAFKDLKIVA
jgi:phasin